MRLTYTDRAKEDLELAFDWYEEQQYGLGIEFLDCLEATIEIITSTPKLYAIHHAIFRRALIRRFPFSIFYTLEKIAERQPQSKEIIVHAIFDNRQDPEHLP